MSSIIKKISDTELEVMKILWASGRSMHEKEISEILTKRFNWKRASIQTFIKRLYEKSVLQREKRDMYYYTPTITRQKYNEEYAKDMLQRVFGGDIGGMIHSLQETLSADEWDKVRRQIQEEEYE